MKNFKSKLRVTAAAFVAVVTLMGVPLTVYAGYAPSGRQTFQCITPTNCPGANFVTFNSFTNASNYGDERAFFDGKDASDTSANGYLDKINVSDGQRLTLRMYVHNNANPAAIGEAAATAKNTKLTVLLPKTKLNSNYAAASISADNSNPGTVSDTVDFTGAQPFTVVFDKSEPVQVTYRPNGTGNYVTSTLRSASYTSDSTMSANVGDWKGCFEYSALITMVVTVKMDTTPPPAYSCDAFNITADINRNVKVSTFNTTATNGAVYKNATLNWGDGSANVTETNIIGQTHKYAKDGTYTISATANFTVNGQTVSASGPNCVKQVTFKGDVPPEVTPPPTTPPPTGKGPTTLVNTGPGQVAAIFAIVSAAGTVAYRWILTRRFGNL